MRTQRKEKRPKEIEMCVGGKGAEFRKESGNRIEIVYPEEQ